MKLSKEQIYNLFVNRKDLFSRQTETGAYIPVRREITLDDIEKHLKGEMTIGLYALDTDNKVKWACVDLDGTDLEQLKTEAMIIYNQFKDFPRCLEFSGRRGYHVWVFFKPRVTADYAQKLVKARLNRVGLGQHELFPKQTSLNDNRSYGNLVKLPLGLHRSSNNRSEIIIMDNVL